MVKNTVIALVAAASLAGIAVPAFAAPVPVANEVNTAFGGGSPEMRAFIADSVRAGSASGSSVKCPRPVLSR